jgi:hypothetical protein
MNATAPGIKAWAKELLHRVAKSSAIVNFNFIV